MLFSSFARAAHGLATLALVAGAFVLPHFVKADVIVTAGSDKKVKLWKAEDGELIKSIDAHDGAVNALAITPDGKTLITGGADKKVKLWKVEDGSLIKSIDAHDGAVTSLFVAADGKSILSGGADKKVKIWDMTGKLTGTVDAASGTIVGISAITEPIQALITAGSEGQIKLWNEDGSMVFFEWDSAHKGGINCMAGNSAEACLYSGGVDGKIKHKSQNDEGEFDKGAGVPINALFTSPDFKLLLAGSADGKVHIFDAPGHKWLKAIDAHDKGEGSKTGVTALLMSPDGKMIFTAGADKKVKAWDKDGKLLKTVDAHDGIVNAFLYIKDKKEKDKEEKK